MTEHKLDGRTKRALDTAIAKRQVSQESYRAVEEGRLSLAEARDLGRNAGPDGPAVRADKDDRSRPCLACGETVPTGNRFHQGCDMKMHRLATEYVRGERELEPEQLEYVQESGKLEKARERVLAEDHAAAIKEDKRRTKQANASE